LDLSTDSREREGGRFARFIYISITKDDAIIVAQGEASFVRRGATHREKLERLKVIKEAAVHCLALGFHSLRHDS
jgi:hypothetical protein